MPFCWCADKDSSNEVTFVVVSATERAGATSLIESIVAEYLPDLLQKGGNTTSVDANGGLLAAAIRPTPLPTIQDMEEYTCEVQLPPATCQALELPSATPQKLKCIDIGRRIRNTMLQQEAGLLHSDPSQTMSSASSMIFSSSSIFGGATSLSSASATRAALGRHGNSIATTLKQNNKAFIKHLKRCDAVVMVMDCSDHEPAPVAERSSSSEQQLSRHQIKLFWDVRRCFAEMVDGVGTGKKRVRRASYPLFVIAANKQDIPGALDVKAVETSLGLTLDNHRVEWICLPCVANDTEFHCHHLMEGVIAHRLEQRRLEALKKMSPQQSVPRPEKRLYRSLSAADSAASQSGDAFAAKANDNVRRPSSRHHGTLDATLFSPAAQRSSSLTDVSESQPVQFGDVDVLVGEDAAVSEAAESSRTKRKSWRPSADFLSQVMRRSTLGGYRVASDEK